jgi:hypothetical protein
VRDWRSSIVKKGYLVLHARGNTGSPGGGRLSDEHDLSPLFATLEALALEETIQQATLQPRRDLPAPTYFCGMSSVPQLARSDRRRLESQRAHPERGNYAETGMEPPTPSMQKAAGSTLPVPARSTMPEPAEETEDVKQKLLTPPAPKGAQGVDDKWSGTVLKPDDSFQPALPRTAAVGLPAPVCRDPGEELLAAFYRGLGTDIGGLTQTIRRRELNIARDLIAVGATPAEAGAYAREASAIPGRIAAVDLRAFERERLSWLGRRQRVGTPPLLRVANGRVPD